MSPLFPIMAVSPRRDGGSEIARKESFIGGLLWLDIQDHGVVCVVGRDANSFSRAISVIQISVPLKSVVMCQENMDRAG